MEKTQVDHGAKGVGRFVALFFDDCQEENPGVVAALLMELSGVENAQHVWCSIQKILEFFWTPQLNAARVNEALNTLQQNYPGLKIYFTKKGLITR